MRANNLTGSEVIGNGSKTRKPNCINAFIQTRGINDAFFRFNAHHQKERPENEREDFQDPAGRDGFFTEILETLTECIQRIGPSGAENNTQGAGG